MLKSLAKNIKSFIISSTIAVGGIFSYCCYVSYQNKRQYLQAINSDSLKDASRLSNQSFGISWGFQADDTVMNSIDTGDLFFIKYQCHQCLTSFDMIKCYKLAIPLLDQQYHAVAVAYRDQSGLMTYFNQFGQNRLMRYSEFVSLPYIKQLLMQKNASKIHNKLTKLLQDDKAFDQIQINEQNNESKSMKFNINQIYEKISKLIVPKQTTFQFINRICRNIQLLKDQDNQVQDIRELFRNQKQVNIRTQTNKTLRSL